MNPSVEKDHLVGAPDNSRADVISESSNRRLWRRLQYSGDRGGSFRIFIWRYLISTVMRGAIYRMFMLSSNGIISVAGRVCIDGPKSNLRFGRRCKIGAGARLQSICRAGLRFGDDVTICEGVIIGASGHWGGSLGHGLVMGNRSSLGAYSYVGCSGSISIGDDVMIGPRVTMIAENHNFADLNRPMNRQGVNNKGIVIGNNVWIGACVTILDGVTIGDHVIVAAGAVVNRDVPPYAVVAGVPARPIRSRLDKWPKAKTEMSR